MKKLFTLVALLTCFMGAQAKTVVDAEINFAEQTAVNWAWGSLVDQAVLDIQDGCLHYSSPGLPEGANPWDTQFVLNGLAGINVEVGVDYTFEMEIKGSAAGNWQLIAFAGVNDYGEPQLPIPTEWTVQQKVYTAVSTDDSNPKLQCGNYAGEWWIKYIKITHEEADDETPVQWENIATNSDASAEWESPEMRGGDEGWENVVAWGKEWGYLMDDVLTSDANISEANAPIGTPIPRPHPATIENGVYVVHAKAVNPPLLWTAATTLYGQEYAPNDPMPHNTWQNQFWINFPRSFKSGEQYKLTFDYKASEAVTVSTQDHQNTPGDYLGGGTVGNLNFDTEWKTFERELTAADGVHSLAFNLTGTGENWKKDIDFFFDNIQVSTMVLEHGYFVTGTDIEDSDPEYQFGKAIAFEFDEASNAYFATIGTEGNKDSWVNQIMISTVKGNTKAFKAGTLKPNGKVVKSDPDEWLPLTEAANAKIDLPALGVWSIVIGIEEDGLLISFEQLEGDQIVELEAIDVVPNPAEIVLKGMPRDFTAAEKPAVEAVEANPEEGIEAVEAQPAGTGQPWDNQFFILANRTLAKDEVTIIEFDYVGSVDAKVTTQLHGQPGAYLHYEAIGDVNFTTGEQHFKATLTIAEQADGMQSIAFNMAEIQGACDYTIKNVQWYVYDESLGEGKTYESLIDMEGVENFIVKEGASSQPHVFGTIYNMFIVGELTGGWPAVSEIGFENWSVAKAMTRDAANPNLYTLETEVEIVNEGQYDYKAVANSRWGFYELPMDGNQNWVFEAGRNYPCGKYNLLFTANTEEHTLTLDVQPVQEGKQGDVNGDGAVDVADISAIISCMAGDNTYAATADVNGDGAVDVADISAVITTMAENARRAAMTIGE